MASAFAEVAAPAATTSHGLDLGRLASFTLFAVAVVGGIWIVERYAPVAYVYLIAEDSFGENATAAAFLIAAACFALSARREAGWRRAFLLIGALACAGIGGEEISWGQRILGIGTPEIIAASNAQGELNIHNHTLLQRLPYHEVIGVTLILLCLLTLLRPRLGQLPAMIDAIPRPNVEIVPVIVVAAQMLIEQNLVKGDEIAELLLGLAMLVWSVELLATRWHAGAPRFVKTVHMTALALVVAIAATLTIGLGQDMTWRFNTTASRDYPRYRMYEQADTLFEHILRHPELTTAVTERKRALVQREAEIFAQLSD